MSAIATSYFGPIVLFVLMLLVGLELSTADFRRIAQAPRAVIVGTLGQLILLPLMTWGVVVALDVPPVFAAGALLVAVAPGAGASNLFAAMARANLALSVTLTAMTSVLTVVTLPIVTSLGLDLFLGESAGIDVRVRPLVEQLAGTVLFPIGLGMTLQAQVPAFVARHKRALHRIGGAVIVVLLVFIAVLSAESDERPPFDAVDEVVVAAAVWTVAAMLIGWILALLLRLPGRDQGTFVIEFSARNVGVSAIVALSGLERLDLSLFSGAYSVIGFPMVAIVAVIMRRRSRGAVVEEP